MNKEYKIKLDLNKKLYNKKMAFNQFDKNVNDFYIEVTKNNEVVKDLDKSIITLVAIKPNNAVDAQFIEVKEGQIYADLKPSMCDLVGNYQAKAMIVLEGEIVTTDTINYSVSEDKIISRLNDDVVSDERFPLFTDALARLSTIEISEEQRVINEAERILSEENRKIEESKRVEAELVRQHEEADRTKYDATRESNENIRKINEEARISSENVRLENEANRIEQETNRVKAEQLRKDNYNFMTEDEERRRLEANAHKEAEVLRVQAETNRVNEEAKRRTTEQARVLAENTRVSNENTRKANEETRQNNETHRVEAETQRQSRYNSFIADAEANANNFENYTNNAKVKEEERKSNELDRKSQEARRVSNEVERISNENTRKANEKAREKNETSRQNIFENKADEVDKKIIELNTIKDNFVSSINTKVDTKISELDNTKSDMTNTVTNKIDEVENRFNALTSKQQQDAEVIDARDGETSLKARLDRDIEKAKQVYVNVKGSHISTDSSVGYLKDVEILGNTIQSASNLADIRSVGDKIEGQELYEIPVLSRGKNLVGTKNIINGYIDGSTNALTSNNTTRSIIVKVKPNATYTISFNKSITRTSVAMFNKMPSFSDVANVLLIPSGLGNNKYRVVNNTNFTYMVFYYINVADDDYVIQLEEGTVATPYEPYQEDKLTILSPVQLEKGDILKEVDGVWGVEKTAITINPNDNLEWIMEEGTASDMCLRFRIKNNPYITGMDTWVISSHFGTVRNNNGYNIEGVGVSSYANYGLMVWINKDKLNSFDSQGFNQWRIDNNFIVKLAITNPQFIPLPHSQQIKLRTFANKTNISFLTEIEGTMKAQVPKSLGATVNTHSEQINNLNKELDRVKKLEESTVSTVETESDFTTVEATSNGYFEDVKLEGKTLTTVLTCSTNKNYAKWTPVDCASYKAVEVGKVYTIIAQTNNTAQCGLKNKTSADYLLALAAAKEFICKTITFSKAEELVIVTDTEGTVNMELMIVEGDHTQNPPNGYIEGLKSVGQSATTSEDGVDEIVVSSVKGDGNLFDESLLSKYITSTDSNEYTLDYTTMYSANFIHPVNGDGQYTFSYTCKETVGNKNPRFIFNYDDDSFENINPLTSNSFTRYSRTSNANKKLVGIKVSFTNSGGNWIIQKDSIILNKGTTPKPYTPHQADKKRLLYYNEETQTWEKPILREWDSIEKHADGKYYYHQRSAEVVLNGSENWLTYSQEDNGCYSASLTLINSANYMGFNVVCDKFNSLDSYGALYYGRGSGIYVGTRNTSDGNVIIGLKNEDLPSRDVAGFKTKLQTLAPITAVYKLAKEKVYECTNIDLITYANETNYVVESGAIVPRTTLKVHNNISNVVSLLQKKVSLLESNVKASQEVQDMMILETDMRMLDIELALMEFVPMTLNLGGSNMLRSATYFNFLKNHIINETYEKEYLENVMNKYLATGRINQDEYNELYKMLYPPVYDIELPIEY